MARDDISRVLIDKVTAWLKQAAINGENLEELVRGCCERLSAAGLPLLRVHVSVSMLHPLYDALGFTWKRGEGVTVEGFSHRKGDDDSPDRFLRSPYFYLLNNNLEHLRRRIDPALPSEFPIFEDLKQIGATDYIAFVRTFGSSYGQGMVGSWSTDHADGFSDDTIEALLRVQSSLAVATKMAVLSKLADNMLTTYLGGNAGRRVLSGQIRRGDGETIRAALIMADMRSSTLLAEREGRQIYIDTLNEFFDAIAAPFNRNGGEILSFVGDGLLAVYPCGRGREASQVAARSAMTAVRQAAARMADLNTERTGRGLEPIGYGIGLHIGNVMFGNVGLRDRLTFSAFGSAVNEVQRLQALTKKYTQPIVASETFSGYVGGEWTEIGQEKLRGIRNKVTVLWPGESNMQLNFGETFDRGSVDIRSEAEQVMLLHRNTAKLGNATFLERLTS